MCSLSDSQIQTERAASAPHSDEQQQHLSFDCAGLVAFSAGMTATVCISHQTPASLIASLIIHSSSWVYFVWLLGPSTCAQPWISCLIVWVRSLFTGGVVSQVGIATLHFEWSILGWEMDGNATPNIFTTDHSILM